MCLDFKNIIYINCDKDFDRNQSIKQDLKELNIEAKRYSAIINNFENFSSDFKQYCETGHPYHSDYGMKLNFPEVGCLLSHLEVIRKYGTNEDLLVFEDDIDLKSIKYWNFRFSEFVKKLPTNTKIVQLIRYPEYSPINLKKLKVGPGYWGTAAYFIKKHYSQQLVYDCYLNNKWLIGNLKSDHNRKSADSVLYSTEESYSCTIFSLKDFKSSINKLNDETNKDIGDGINYHLKIIKPDLNCLFEDFINFS